MGSLTAGAGVLVVLSALIYFGARLAPEARSEAELKAIRSARGDRVAQRFRQMDQQRSYMVQTGRIVLPVALGLFVLALVVDLVV